VVNGSSGDSRVSSELVKALLDVRLVKLVVVNGAIEIDAYESIG
jgi:hypothetical protein